MATRKTTPAWGVPNWQQAAAYPPADAPVCVFVWEFLRRRPAMRAGWTRWLETQDSDEPLNPALPYWDCTTGEAHGKHQGIRIHSCIVGFDNTLFPRRADRGGTLGAVQPGHMHIDFDCGVPLDEQFRLARLLANMKQRELEKHSVPVRRKHSKLRPEKLIVYLRILDAVDASATSAQICAVLRIGADAEKDARKKARELRDGDYREIQSIKPNR